MYWFTERNGNMGPTQAHTSVCPLATINSEEVRP